MFEELAAAQEALAERTAEALSADTVDPSALASVEEEAARLAADVVRESFSLIAAVAAELTPGQRAEIVRHWKER